VDLKLFFGGSDPADFSGPGRQFLHYLFSGAAKQDGLQLPAHLIQMPVTQYLALFILDPMSVEETEGWSESPFVYEFHDGIELIEAILERGAGEYQGKR